MIRCSMFVVACLVAAGCGGPREAEVSGKVTFEGQPIPKGTMSFFPVDGKATTSGAFIEAGEYKAKVPYGTMIVRISYPKVTGKRKLYPNNPKSPEMDLFTEALPERYNEKSEMTIDVKDAMTRKDFDLKK